MNSTPYPLARTSEDDLQALCMVLWDWPDCNCRRGSPCGLVTCPWKRRSRLERFFEQYQHYASNYVPSFRSGYPNALNSHQELLDVIRRLKRSPQLSRRALTDKIFTTIRPGSKAPHVEDQNRAIDLAVRISLMINCTSSNGVTGDLEMGTEPLAWTADMSLQEFLEGVFGGHTQSQQHENLSVHLATLSARRILKIAGLKIRRTDDLKDHLRIDEKADTLTLFDNTAFLKEHLAASRTGNDCFPFPRQLGLEALNTIQEVLFPPDADSQALLRSLIAKQSFDRNILPFETATYLSKEEGFGSYQFLGSRLLDLQDELNNPRPRSYLEKWFERRSGARYVMMATFIGVIFAVLLGFMALGVSIFQAWVGWQQWQHPKEE